MSEGFPFRSHLTLADADLVQAHRVYSQDMLLLAAHPQRLQHIPKWRLAEFMRRNPRPTRDAA